MTKTLAKTEDLPVTAVILTKSEIIDKNISSVSLLIEVSKNQEKVVAISGGNIHLRNRTDLNFITISFSDKKVFNELSGLPETNAFSVKPDISLGYMYCLSVRKKALKKISFVE